jgi:para-nitrobenzyl esterase
MCRPVESTTADAGSIAGMPHNEVRRRLLRAGALWLSGTGGVLAADARAPRACTRAGIIEGLRADDIYVFRGIPYGADTRVRRFCMALPPVPWSGVRTTQEYGPAAPQVRSHERIDEDCLRLNAWTPGLRDGAARPIMVYLHGGEFSTGSGSAALYDGARLAQRGDVVVITLNHRLSALGHLYLRKLDGAFPDSGNAGLLDVILALRWVRAHAHELGGDPQRVLLFGQSGGGAKIATLMAMPAARGLFHRAATMSGQQITAASPMAATRRAHAYLDALGVAPGALNRLNALPLERLVEAMAAPDVSLIGRSLYFGPVFDGVHLPRHPFYPDAPALSRDIPMIIGNTREETRYFYARDPEVHRLTWAALPAKLTEAIYVDIDVDAVIAAYRRRYPEYSPTQVFFAASTAGRSWRGAIIESELRAQQGAPVYAYQLDYRSPIDDGRWGACHTLDIGLVFGNLDAPDSLTGTDLRAQRMSHLMQDAFIAFARHGDPNARGDAPPRWRPYELPRRETMIFDAQPRLTDDPRGQERALFSQVPYVQRGTF